MAALSLRQVYKLFFCKAQGDLRSQEEDPQKQTYPKPLKQKKEQLTSAT